MQRRLASALGVLQQRDEQERDDRRDGVDDRLPGVDLAQNEDARQPQRDDEHARGEEQPAAGERRRGRRIARRASGRRHSAVRRPGGSGSGSGDRPHRFAGCIVDAIGVDRCRLTHESPHFEATRAFYRRVLGLRREGYIGFWVRPGTGRLRAARREACAARHGRGRRFAQAVEAHTLRQYGPGMSDLRSG
jgi:hypothetical protein